VYVKENGPGRTVYYNNAGRILREDYGYLGNTTYEYNANGFLKKKTERNGKVTEYAYDSANRVKDLTTTFKDTTGSSITTTESYTYYDNDNVKSYTDAAGVVTYYEYYSDNNIKKITRAGKTTDYTYNSNGLMETVHDSERLSKKYSYDQYGNIMKIENLITGNSQTFEYNAAGKLQSQVDEAGLKKIFDYDTDFPSKIKTIETKYPANSNPNIPTLGDETITYYYSTAENVTRGNILSVNDINGTVTNNYSSSTGLLTSTQDRVSGTRSYTYDNMGRVKTVTDSEAGSKSYNYDEYGNLASVSDSYGRKTGYGYDNMGNRTSVIDRNGKQTVYAYDGLSRLRTITDANNGVTEYRYDSLGNRTDIIDAEGNHTQYIPDKHNRIEKELYDDNSYVKFIYSAEGDLRYRQVYNAAGAKEKEQALTYDYAHRLKNDEIYEYTYGTSGCSCANKIHTVTDTRGTTTIDYDGKSRVTDVTYPDSTVVSKVYNDTLKTRQVKLGNDVLFTLQLDAEGRTVKVTDDASKEFVFTRDSLGRQTELLYPNKTKSQTTYDKEGRIVKQENLFSGVRLNIFDFTGQLDAEGNKLKETTVLGQKSYAYDNIYQLKSAQYEKGDSFTWNYDNSGNRVSSNEIGIEKTYSPNNLNQYESVGAIHESPISYQYDADGNLLSGRFTYGWDKRNRLVSVNMGTQGTVTYKYDHNDLRVERTKGAVTTKYYYDGSLLLAEKENNKLTKVYINDGTGIIGMVRYIYKEDGTLSHKQKLYFLFDSLGSVSLVTSETGEVVTNYTYTPYGELMNMTSDPVNSLTFVGKYGGHKDYDTGLTYFWHRWYDGRDGRWVSRDPIGVKDNLNLYSYVDNKVIRYIDYEGLCKLPGDYISMPVKPEKNPGYISDCYLLISRMDCEEQPVKCEMKNKSVAVLLAVTKAATACKYTCIWICGMGRIDRREFPATPLDTDLLAESACERRGPTRR